jgi:hypothetical protein
VLYPEVAAEWHPERNGQLTPDQVTPGSGQKVWWRCSANPSHEWAAKISHRVNGVGCPYCTIFPRSKDEVILAWQLKSFFDFDVDDHKVPIGTKVYDIDIIVPTLRLAVEFDGYYWHQHKIDRDRKKSEKLIRAGWRVIRVREEPLRATGPNDVIVQPQAHKTMANLLLLKIGEVCGVTIDRLQEYLASEELTNLDQATAHIKRLLKDKVTVQLAPEVIDPQMNLW